MISWDLPDQTNTLSSFVSWTPSQLRLYTQYLRSRSFATVVVVSLRGPRAVVFDFDWSLGLNRIEGRWYHGLTEAASSPTLGAN